MSKSGFDFRKYRKIIPAGKAAGKDSSPRKKGESKKGESFHSLPSLPSFSSFPSLPSIKAPALDAIKEELLPMKKEPSSLHKYNLHKYKSLPKIEKLSETSDILEEAIKAIAESLNMNFLQFAELCDSFCSKNQGVFEEEILDEWLKDAVTHSNEENILLPTEDTLMRSDLAIWKKFGDSSVYVHQELVKAHARNINTEADSLIRVIEANKELIDSRTKFGIIKTWVQEVVNWSDDEEKIVKINKLIESLDTFGNDPELRDSELRRRVNKLCDEFLKSLRDEFDEVVIEDAATPYTATRPDPKSLGVVANLNPPVLTNKNP